MNTTDDTIGMPTPPISSSTGMSPQETLLQRGAFDPPATPGTLGCLERFEILRLLGEGGMGLVYLAREPRTDTRVAIKIVKPRVADDPQIVHRFLTEARHMYRLSHPRILRVLEVSDRKESPYYVMPYIEGGSLLGQYTPEHPLSTEKILAIAHQVAEALAYAHAHGLIHRDLKPANVLLDNDGNAYLTDFGLVRTVFNDSMVDASASHLEGTAPYMSPAVARGEAEDTRCDIYAFGALLYELLTGQPPYTGRTPQMILDQVLKGPPTPIRTINPKASSALAKIAEGCMARELRDRYATMADVVADLNRAAKGQASLGAHRQQSRLPRLAALLVGTLAAAGVIVFAVHHFSSAAPDTVNTTRVQSLESKNSSRTSTAPTTLKLPEGLVAWWSGDGTAWDSVRRCDGVAVNGADFAPGVNGQAFHVNGNNQYFKIPHDPALAFTNGESITLEAWVFRTGTSLPFHIVGKRPLPTEGISFYQMGYDGRDPEIPTNQWTHLVDTFSNNVSCRYMNGILASKRLIDWRIGPNNADIHIGTSGNYECFDGLIQHVRIYKRALSASEVSSLNAAGIVAATECTFRGPSINASGRTVQIPYTYMTNNNAITITKYTGPGGAVTIPSTINGLPVASLGYCAFFRGDLTSVTIPDGVTHIESFAFWYCEGLTSLTIPKSVYWIAGNAFCGCFKLNGIKVEATNPRYCSTADGVVFNKEKTQLVRYPSGRAGNYVIPPHTTSIGRDAFTGSINLTDIKIPNSVTNIEDYAFAGCNKLTKVVIPDSIISIGEGLFADCGSLTGITIPKSITHIGNNAFANCCGLTNVEIPASVTNIGGNPFSKCIALASFVVDAQNPTYCTSEDGILYNKGRTTLIGYPGGKAGGYNIPSGVIRIGDNAFRGCPYLTYVTIPASVTSIGSGVFCYSDNLTEIYFKGSVPRFGNNIFEGSNKVKIYYRPSATGWGKEFGGRPTAVWQDAPTGAGKPATEETVPFTYTTNNNAITINKYTGPGGDVVIPDKINGLQVACIGDSAFAWTSLTSMTLPASVTSIGSFAFACCTNLTSIIVDTANPTLCSVDGILYSKDKTTLICYPAGKTEKSYAIPPDVEKVVSFRGCSRLTTVTIPPSAKSLCARSFLDCSELSSINVDRDNPLFFSENGIVYNKKQTTLVCYPPGKKDSSYTLPRSVTEIAPEAFYSCSHLNTITIPSGITNIGAWTFAVCGSLRRVCFEGNAVPISDFLFAWSDSVVVYYRPGTKGWGPTFGGRPTAVWEDAPTGTGKPATEETVPFTYTTNNNAITITKYTGPGGEVAIPKEINGRPVTSIGWQAFIYRNNVTTVKIPDSVTHIGISAFFCCGGLTNVTLPNSLIELSVEAFAHCGLSNITIPASVTSMGVNPLVWCWQLTSVTVDSANPAYCNNPDGVVFNKDKSILVCCPGGKDGSYVIPNSVTQIGRDAFSGCAKLTSITIPNSVTNIGPWAFYCERLTNIVIPDSVISLEDGAFTGCPSLTRITIPKSVTSIGNGMFNHCRGLSAIVVDTANPAYSSVDGVLMDKQKTCLIRYPGGKTGSCEIPQGITKIGLAAFQACGSLLSVMVPNSVTNIDAEAFSECGKLTAVYFKGDAPIGATDRSIFRNGDKVTVYYRPGTKGWGPTFGGRPTAVWETDIHDFACVAENGGVAIVKYTGEGGAIVIPAKVNGLQVMRIKDAAFQNCLSVTSVAIPNSVTNIGNKVFKDCTNLVTITLGNGLISIGEDLFSGCSKLTHVNIPASVTSIGGTAFLGCRSLVSIMVDVLNPVYSSSADAIVFNKEKTWLLRYPTGRAGSYTIPGSITGIGANAFRDCASLTSVTIPDSVTDIQDWAFSGCAGLTEVNLPRSINRVSDTAFAHCSRLSRITVDDANGVYSSKDGVLLSRDGTRLVRYPSGRNGDYVIPSTVNSIGYNAFLDCEGLSSVTIPFGVKVLLRGAFKDCTSLTNAMIPSSVTVFDGHFWGGGAFDGCSKLTSIMLPRSLTDLGSYAFNNCSNLTSVSIPESVTNIMDHAFTGCARITSINLPANVKSIGEHAFRGCSGLKSVSIPSGILTLQFGVFKDCVSLSNVTIPDGVTTIMGQGWSGGAFQGCIGLTNVTIPKSVTKIDECAFLGCPNLTHVYFKGDAPNGASDKSIFQNSNKVIVYYRPGTKGWGKEFGGRPTAGWEAGKTLPSSAAPAQPAPRQLPQKPDADKMPAASDTRRIQYLRDAHIGLALTVYSSVSGLTLICAPGLPNKTITLERAELTDAEFCSKLEDLLKENGVHIFKCGDTFAKVAAWNLENMLKMGVDRLAPATVTLADQGAPMQIKYLFAPVEVVLRAYAEMSGRTMYVGKKISTYPITFSTQGFLTQQKCLQALDNVLLLHDIRLVALDGKRLGAIRAATREAEMASALADLIPLTPAQTLQAQTPAASVPAALPLSNVTH